MISIYQRALGSDFEKLHPQIQRRFSLHSQSGVAAVGTGTMERIWHGPFWTLLFLCLGTWRRIMFPEHGENVPFTIRNYAYLDPLGRETVTWVRTFSTTKTRRFDAYMVYSKERACVVDYLGSHQHLAVDLLLRVESNGGLRLRSGQQRFYERRIGFTFPQLFSGEASVCEWYDDREQCFRIEVNVANRSWGPLFGYNGRFTVDWIPATPGQMPPDLLPRRTETRP